MNLPIVVTHPSTLFHNGLRQLFTKSSFRPLRIATSLTEDLESYLGSLKSGVWLTGVEKSIPDTNALVRRVVTANPGVKAVVLAPLQRPEDIVAALKAGACGFLYQDMPGDRLLRSLELIAHGEMIVHPQFLGNEPATAEVVNGSHETKAYVTTSGEALAQRFQGRSSLARVAADAANENQGDVPSLSRREMLILRMLMQGASNKMIARNLVITESTVKVHMKAILRKLRLQNRTQAAIWARNHVNESDWNNRATAGSAH